MKEDPIVSEVRRIREELANKFNFDVGAIFEDLRKRQTQFGSRLIRRKKKDDSKISDVSDRDSATIHPGR